MYLCAIHACLLSLVFISEMVFSFHLNTPYQSFPILIFILFYQIISFEICVAYFAIMFICSVVLFF